MARHFPAMANNYYFVMVGRGDTPVFEAEFGPLAAPAAEGKVCAAAVGGPWVRDDAPADRRRGGAGTRTTGST